MTKVKIYSTTNRSVVLGLDKEKINEAFEIK